VPQQYRRGKTQEPKSILASRKATTAEDLNPQQAIALAGLLASAIRNNNAVYIQPGRYSTITFKVYIEGDQFAEVLTLDSELENLCEQIVETLYTQEDVAWNRRAFGTARDGRPPKARSEG
jgi:hypothetical protein